MMEETGGVLVLTSDPSAMQLISASLAGEPRFQPLTGCRDMADLVARLERQTPLAAVVDIDANPARMLADLASLGDRFVDTRLVLLSSEPTSELMLEAMQIGARHLLAKAAVARQIAGVLGRLVAATTTHATAGHLYTVLSSGGGCGATTLAVNLAAELRLLDPDHPALLVDLDSCTGGAAISLGLRGDYGIADVLAHEGPSDPHLVRSTAATCTNGLHMLLSPASVDFVTPPAMAYGNLGRVLTACRMAYPNTVVDAPRVPISVSATLAAVSHATLITLQLNVRDIRLARQTRQALIHRGVDADRILLVVNRYNRRYSPISMEDAQRALGTSGLYIVANDFAAAGNSLNLGRPLAEVSPGSSLRKDIRRLAEQFADSRAEQPAPARG